MKRRLDITQEELKNVINYDPDTGVFTWKDGRNGRVKVGGRAGYKHKLLNGKCYRRIKICGKDMYENVLAFIYMKGKAPELIDHINGNGEDNRWTNLKGSNYANNAKNKRLYSNNNSGITGVRFNKHINRYQSFISREYIGSFDNFEDAACARRHAEFLHGYHDNHGEDRPL
jgi:hypothetical protein